MKYKVTHIRPECIGCAACVTVCPAYWEMGSDGKSDLKKAKTLKNGNQERVLEKDLECNQEAMNVCPVQIIKIKENVK